MKQHDANAKELVSYLENEPLVEEVLYAGKGCIVWVPNSVQASGSIHSCKVYVSSHLPRVSEVAKA